MTNLPINEQNMYCESGHDHDGKTKRYTNMMIKC